MRRRVPPQEVRAFCCHSAEFQLTPSRNVLVSLGRNWKSEGFLSLPQGHSDSDGDRAAAPESQSCGGTTRPFLLLVCNPSKYRPSQTPSLNWERIHGTAAALNPFPHQTEGRKLRKQRFRWEFPRFGPRRDVPGLREQSGVTLTQLFLCPCVHFACLFPVQAVLRELCYAAGSVLINQLRAELGITGFIWFGACDSCLSFLAWHARWKLH